MLLMAGTPAIAEDSCANVPDIAKAYLNAHPGWRILRVADLYSDDQHLWRQYHKGKCPGLAEVDLDGSGTMFVGLALIRPDKSAAQERIVVVRAGPKEIETQTLYRDFEVTTHTVIWRAPPGITWQWDEPNKKIRIANDSLIVETMESSAQQFYLKNGKLAYIQTSD